MTESIFIESPILVYNFGYLVYKYMVVCCHCYASNSRKNDENMTWIDRYSYIYIYMMWSQLRMLISFLFYNNEKNYKTIRAFNIF